MLGYQYSATSLYTVNFSNLVTTNDFSAPYQPIVLRKSQLIWMQLNNYETIYDSLTGTNYFCQFDLHKTPNNAVAYDTFMPNVQVFVDAIYLN